MRPHDWQVRLIQLLAVAGLFVAYYLLLYHNGTLVAVCSGNGWDDCGQVSGPNALYSSFGPVPVALIGLMGYALIFLLTWLPGWWPGLDDYLPELLVGTIGLGFLFSIGLTALELFVIHALCRYCVMSAVLVTIMLALAISYLVSLQREA